VLPDTLAASIPSVYNNIPPRLPADIIADAQRTLVVRDGVASFFYNPGIRSATFSKPSKACSISAINS